MSIGIILQIMPSLPISQVILHIIGMPMPIIGIIIGIMPMIWFMRIIGFMLIIWIMPIIGFMPIMGFIIPLFIIGIIIGIPMVELFIGCGIAFIMMWASYVSSMRAQGPSQHTAGALGCFLCSYGGVSRSSV